MLDDNVVLFPSVSIRCEKSIIAGGKTSSHFGIVIYYWFWSFVIADISAALQLWKNLACNILALQEDPHIHTKFSKVHNIWFYSKPTLVRCYELSFPFNCTIWLTIRYDRLPRGLACMACTGVSSRTGYDVFRLYYDPFYSTMTRSAPLWHTVRPPTVPWHHKPLVGYKVAPLWGYVSRVFFVHSTAIRTILLLISILSLLPKDQTLKRVTKQLRSHLTLLNTSHPDKTLSPYDLASSPRIAQSASQETSYQMTL